MLQHFTDLYDDEDLQPFSSGSKNATYMKVRQTLKVSWRIIDHFKNLKLL